VKCIVQPSYILRLSYLDLATDINISRSQNGMGWSMYTKLELSMTFQAYVTNPNRTQSRVDGRGAGLNANVSEEGRIYTYRSNH